MPSAGGGARARGGRGGGCPVAAEPVEGGDLVVRCAEVDLQALDFAEPAVESGLGDPLGEVVDDLDEAVALGGVDAQHRAADAGVFVFAGGAVGPGAGAELELAQSEVGVELAPFVLGRVAVFGLRSRGATL